MLIEVSSCFFTYFLLNVECDYRTLTTGLTMKISDFVHSSPVKMRRQTFPETTSVAAGALRWQIYNEADWEKA